MTAITPEQVRAIVTTVLREREHTATPEEFAVLLQAGIEASASGMELLDGLEDAFRAHEAAHPVHPEWHRQRRAARIAAHEREQAAEAAERKARKRNLRAST